MFWRLHLLGWIVYGAGTYLATLARITPDQFLSMFELKVVRTALGFGASLLLHAALRRLRHGGAGWGTLAAVSLPLGVALGALWLLAYWSATTSLRGAGLLAADWATFPRAMLDHAFVLLTSAAAGIGFHEWRARESAEQRVRDAELERLRYQLNPHFLFNALTALRASIPVDAEPARDNVDALAGFLRHALRTSPTRTVPLAHEIDATSNYLAMERARYGPRLEVHVDVDPSVAQVEIPGFLLQPLAENAVKHGMAAGIWPLVVTLRATRIGADLRIDVTNSSGAAEARQHPFDTAPPAGHRIGLDNVRERLRQHYGDRATFALRPEGSGAVASILIAAVAKP